MNILGIETSCDETAASVVKDGKHILSSVVASQADLFADYGGVIPEVASRKHLELLVPVIEKALKESKLKLEDIDAVAYTKEPGLTPALLVGISHAKALALARNIPAIPINHLEAHVFANSLMPVNDGVEEIVFPHICLLVSGGHTIVILVQNQTKYKILGSTIDDAAGEAFDKVARLLELPYPGGPIIDKLSLDGDPTAYQFPRPLSDKDNYDFSFSGLKTAVMYEVKKSKPKQISKSNELNKQLMENWKSDIAASFQEAVVDILVEKTMKVAIANSVELVTMAGGVAANSRLREKMIRMGNEIGIDVRYPEINMCMDNAAMIAGLAYFQNENR